MSRSAEQYTFERQAGAPSAAADAVRRARGGALARAFEGLGHVPFRWYMGAMIWWNAAMSMQMLVRGYLAYQLTESFASLGVISLVSAIPMLLLSPVGGVIADRCSRRAVLQAGQVVSLLVAAVVAVLVLSDRVAFWHLVAASIAQGVTFALVMPSRQSLLPEVVGMGRLMNAIPLQTAGMNLMQILAPALGGFMIDWVGPGWVYVVMAGMYGLSVALLFFVRSMTADELERSQRDAPSNAFVGSGSMAGDSPGRRSSELVAGFRYLGRDRTTLAVLAFSFIASILAMPIRLLLPGYAAAVFGDEGSTLGMLQMGMGLGALAGALVLAAVRIGAHRGVLLACSAVLMGVALIGFSATSVLWVAWLAIAGVGLGSAGRIALGQVLVQEYVQDEYRGRVMAIYMMQFSMMSVGTFGVSLYMEAVGAEMAILTLGATLIVTTAAYLALVPRFRHVD